MTSLLELREKIRDFYRKFDIYIKPAVRFITAIITFLMINGNIGYMSRLRNPAIAIVLAMLCTFLPVNATVAAASLLILAHLSALSMEVCAVALLLLLAMLFMYFKYAPKDGFAALLTPVFCKLGIAEIMPTGLGLTKTPYSIISMVCGLIFYYFLRGVKRNEGLLSAVDEEMEVSKFTVALQQIIGNKELYITLTAFVAAAIIIYIIRRQSFANSWTIAVAVGNAVSLLILLVGSFVTENTGAIPMIIIGTLAAVAAGLLLQFFLFHLDYARTERVQFEDDEYYYYVKAVPKVAVAGKDKKVKKINSRSNSGISKKQLADEFDIDQELLED